MHWGRLVAAIALAVPLLIGCDWNRLGYEVINHTDRTLNIYLVIAGREEQIASLGPGQSVMSARGIGPGECTEGDLVARDSSGAEVARRTEPICDRQTWVIGTPPP